MNPCQEVVQHRNDDGLSMNFILSNGAHRCLIIGWNSDSRCALQNAHWRGNAYVTGDLAN